MLPVEQWRTYVRVVAAAFTTLFSRAESDASLTPSSDVTCTASSVKIPTVSVLVKVVPLRNGVRWTMREEVTVSTSVEK